MLLSSLTNLPLPPLRHAVLGLLVAMTCLSAPAQGPQAPIIAEALPAMEATDRPLAAYFAGAHLADVTPSLTPPPPCFQKTPDGTTVVTIQWDTNDGESIERHSTDLFLATPVVPEPSPLFLGACAGCIVLLHRRRAQPSNLRPARAILSVSVSARPRPRPSRSRLAPISRIHVARAPQERLTLPEHRLTSRRTAQPALLPS
jgi:hypothetical protein